MLVVKYIIPSENSDVSFTTAAARRIILHEPNHLTAEVQLCPPPLSVKSFIPLKTEQSRFSVGWWCSAMNSGKRKTSPAPIDVDSKIE